MSAPTVAPSTATRTVEMDDIPYVQWMEGLEAKLLRCSVPNNEYTLMVKFGPGVQLPRHKHMGPVHAITLQGRWRYLEYDWEATAGSYVFEPAMSDHTLKVNDDNDEDTVVIFTIRGGLVLLGENDELFWWEDVEGMMKLYQTGLDNLGLDWPDQIVME